MVTIFSLSPTLLVLISGNWIFSRIKNQSINKIVYCCSVAGSLVYTWVTFREKETRKSGIDVDAKPLLTKEKESPA